MSIRSDTGIEEQVLQCIIGTFDGEFRSTEKYPFEPSWPTFDESDSMWIHMDTRAFPFPPIRL